MIIGDIIQRVNSIYSSGIKNDDSRLSERRIYNKFMTVRSRIIMEDYRKNRTVNDYTKQMLYVNMMKESIIPCSKNVTCSNMTSGIEIPVFIGNEFESFTKVYSEDGVIEFNKILFSDVKHLVGNKYVKTPQCYFFKDKKLKIVNSGMKKVIIENIWENPIEVHRLTETCLKRPYTDVKDIDSYTPANLIDIIIELVAQELIIEAPKKTYDDSNDSKDN